jgi:hypothetical protein
MVPCLLAACLVVHAEPAQTPVGMVVSVKGTVTVERGKDKIALEEADWLLPGDRLAAAANGEAVLFFLEGGVRQRLKAGKQASVGTRGCDPAAAVEAVTGGRTLPKVALSDLKLHSKAVHAAGGRAAVGVLRGHTEATAAVTPMAGSRVLTDHPTLSWPPVPGAETYLIELFPADEGSGPLWRASAREARLPYPEEEAVLKPGLKYRWRVSARVGGEEKEVVRSSFFTMTESRVRDLARLRSLAASADPGDWLLAAASYEAAGVYGKALPLFERLAEKAPQAANYQEVLAQYYQRAGQPDKARAAAERARKLREAGREGR